MRLFVPVVMTLCLCICCSAFAQEDFELPNDETTPVFSMEYVGGMRAPRRNPLPEGWEKKPYLQIFADGRIVNSPNAPEYPAYEIQLNEAELNEILSQIVTENKFYEIDVEQIKKEQAAAGRRAIIADAPALKFSMELGRGTHSFRFMTPSSSATQHPNIEALQHVAAIEKIGKRLVAVAIGGGYENIERALGKVNEDLEKDGIDPLTMDDLSYCRERDGVISITFNKKFYLPNGRWRDYVTGTFTIDGDDESVKITSKITK